MGIRLRIPFGRLEAVAFIIGMAVLTFELAAARIVSPYLGDTIYSWTSIIGVILAALALGYAYGGVWADKRKDKHDIVICMLVAAGLIVLVNVLKDPALSWISRQQLPLQFQSLAASMYLFALPTFLLGMASPYITRLTIDTVATSGRHLSRIDAASTYGSLTGTFLTGYILFGLIGTRHLLVYVSAVLVLATFLIEFRRLLWWRLGLLALIGVAGMYAPSPHLSGLIKDLDTAYNRIIIRTVTYQGREIRIYQTDPNGLQSGIYTGGGKKQVFTYIRAFSAVADLRPAGDRYLVIGGGAFTFPEYLARKEKKATVDTVEIDAKLPAISKEYFGFKQPDNLRIISADGRQYLNNTKDRYAMMYIDAFSGSVPPFQLMTREAVARMHRVLDNDGIVVANVIAPTHNLAGNFGGHVLATFKTAFPHVALYPVQYGVPADTPQNVLLVASKRPLVAPSAVSHPGLAALLATPSVTSADKKLVMTDDFAPVEQLVQH